MTEKLFSKDSYLKEFEATVTDVNSREIELDRTAFYPEGGGQPFDTGKIVAKGDEYNVISVRKQGNRIIHTVDKEGLKKGDDVRCSIDWQRRHTLMRMHTAAHILSAVIHRKTQALITGNQLGTDRTRIDFSLENFDKDKIQDYIEKSNQEIKRNQEIKTYFVDKNHSDAALSKLAAGIGDVDEVKIVEIGDVDKQPDGGTHVRNTSEIGRIDFLKAENKGKNNRRIYFTLS
jgi:Ser-tRNA(Ala) deacylase AlaX